MGPNLYDIVNQVSLIHFLYTTFQSDLNHIFHLFPFTDMWRRFGRSEETPLRGTYVQCTYVQT